MTFLCTTDQVREARRVSSKVITVASVDHLDTIELGPTVFVWHSQRLLGMAAKKIDAEKRRGQTVLVPVAFPKHGAIAQSKLGVSPRYAKAMMKGSAHVDDFEVASLKTDFTGFERTMLCFSVGFGTWQPALEAANSTGSRLAALASSVLEPTLEDADPFRMTVDGTPEMCRFAYVSALRKGPFGLHMRRNGVSLLAGEQQLGPGQLLVPGVGNLVGDPKKFERIHMDVVTGYVVDDESYPANEPQGLRIVEGPTFKIGA